MFETVGLMAWPIAQGAIVAASVIGAPGTIDSGATHAVRYATIEDSVARAFNPTLTSPLHRQVEPSKLVGSRMDVFDHDLTRGDESWLEDTRRDAAWAEVEGRLAEAFMLDDGWNGEGSLAGDPALLMGSAIFLEKLEEQLPAGPVPMLAVDSDGLPVLSWQRNGLYGSLTVYERNAYAYYVKRGTSVAEASSDSLRDPISERLLEILRG